MLLGVDSLRADHLSSYGYARCTSLHLDRLADTGVLFERHYAPSIPTTLAYCSMLTGMDVLSTCMVALAPKEPLPDHIRTLPELLKARGYVSACAGFERQKAVLYRGFDQCLTYRAWCTWNDRPADKAEQLNAVTVPLLDEFAQTDQPFLLVLRHMDPHAPYLPPSAYDRRFYRGDETDPAHLLSERSMAPVFDFAPIADFCRSWMPPGLTDQEYVVAQYDGAIAYMDRHIGRLLARLEELGIAGQTIVVLTADPGVRARYRSTAWPHHDRLEIAPLTDEMPWMQTMRGAGIAVDNQAILLP